MGHKNKPFRLQGPKGVKIQRHNIGGEKSEIRFTIPADGFDKLVAVTHGETCVWLHKDFSSN